MEQVKMYRISIVPILSFMLAGIIIFLLSFGDVKGIITHIYIFLGGLLLSFVFLGYSFYLLNKRKQGKSFYWDDEGIVIDLQGNKVYWDEIEEIKLIKGRSGKSTVIYPHYTNHEKIRIRRKKKMPTPAHSIEWFIIEKPKEFHKNLMKFWEEKSKLQKLM